MVRYLPYMQIFVIWVEALWQLTILAFFKVRRLKAQICDQTGLLVDIEV